MESVRPTSPTGLIGPQYYFFNGGKGSVSLDKPRSEAEALASPAWNTAFYDSIARHVIDYVPSSRRGGVKGIVKLPEGASRPIAILTADGFYFQDNSAVSDSYQYWYDINRDGSFNIDHVKEGIYRLTIYAEGVFGDFVHDGIVVRAGKKSLVHDTWNEESAGTKIWGP